ncbi:MAG: hypothetical protein V1735_00835 [Nanoarchaeota archaeon]
MDYKITDAEFPSSLRGIDDKNPRNALSIGIAQQQRQIDIARFEKFTNEWSSLGDIISKLGFIAQGPSLGDQALADEWGWWNNRFDVSRHFDNEAGWYNYVLDPELTYCEQKYNPSFPVVSSRLTTGSYSAFTFPNLGQISMSLRAWRRENLNINNNPPTAMHEFCYDNSKENHPMLSCASTNNNKKTAKFPYNTVATWFPGVGANEDAPPPPLGYYYHLEWTITNPYTEDMIKEERDANGQDIPQAIINKKGNITYRIRFFCDNCQQSSFTINGRQAKTSYEWRHGVIEPGKTAHFIAENYTINYYNTICIVFDDYRYRDSEGWHREYPADCQPKTQHVSDQEPAGVFGGDVHIYDDVGFTPGRIPLYIGANLPGEGGSNQDTEEEGDTAVSPW